MGGILAVLFSPWLNRLQKKVPAAVGATLLTLGITIVVILPTSLLLYFAIKTGLHQLQDSSSAAEEGVNLLDRFINIPSVHAALDWIVARTSLTTEELANTIKDWAGQIGTRVAEISGAVLTQIPGILFMLGVTIVSVYVFLMDGNRLVREIRKNKLFTTRETNQLISCVAETCRSVLLAALVSGAVQSVIEVIPCLLTGQSNSVMIGLMVFVGSFIPVVGSAPITFGIAGIQFLSGKNGLGFLFLIVAIIVTGIDNYIRPKFLKGSTQLHPMIAFVSTFGGLQALGFTGVFLGPIIASLFLELFKISTKESSHS